MYINAHAINPNYKEILRLDTMLTEAEIPHILRTYLDGYQVCYPVERPGNDCIMDAIEHCGSYGQECDLLEIMGLLTPEEEEYDSVVGNLTAEEVFERIRKHWNGEWDEYIANLPKTNAEDEFDEDTETPKLRHAIARRIQARNG